MTTGMKTRGTPAESPLTRLADDQGLLLDGVRGSIRGSSPCLHASPLLSKPHFPDPPSQSLMGCFFPHVGCWRTWLGLDKISLVTELVKGPHLRSRPRTAVPGPGPHPHPGPGGRLHLPKVLLLHGGDTSLGRAGVALSTCVPSTQGNDSWQRFCAQYIFVE